MASIAVPPFLTRLGFHYYPDTVHYREQDLQTWLPRLEKLRASWLTLLAPAGRAIPEYFLSSLLEAGIQPVLHLPLSTDSSFQREDFRLLFTSYARWGVRYMTLFDCPNMRANWHPAIWAQTDLVERFLDLYLPLAEMVVDEGLIPVFPPLQPGGDYWDLAFLKAALMGVRRRGYERLLEVLVLGAYAWSNHRPLDWGAGGPERWPGARPYVTSPGNQDHLGFCIYDWYLAIAQQALERRLPILLLRAGSRPEDHPVEANAQMCGVAHALKTLETARWVVGEEGENNPQAEVPAEVLACNFWLLAAAPESPTVSQAWFGAGDQKLPVVDAFQSWVANVGKPQPAPDEPIQAPRGTQCNDNSITATGDRRVSPPILHYVLLPLYSWGVADWDLKVIEPILERSHPTIGFSLAEACLAARVTVVGGEGAFSKEVLDLLCRAGCVVERLLENGTLVAT